MSETNVEQHTGQLNPDRRYVAIGAIVLVMVVMLASMVFSFTAITESAAWTGNPSWTHVLAAVFIDGAIITYSVSYAVFRWRGEPGKRTLAFLYGFTFLSVVVNFAHAAHYWEWSLTTYEAWFGVIIAIAAPVAAVLAAEEVVRMAFARRKYIADAFVPAFDDEAEVEPEPEAPAVEAAPEPVQPKRPQLVLLSDSARDLVRGPEGELSNAGI